MAFGTWLRKAALAGLAATAPLGGAAAEDFIRPHLDLSTAFCAGNCAVSVFAGRRLDTSMSSALGISNFKPPTEWKFGSSGIVAGTFSRRLVSFGTLFDIEAEIGAGQRFGSLNEQEGWVALYGRWLWFPWNDWLKTSVAVSTGINVASDVPRYEAERSGRKNQRVLHYFSPEIAFSLPSKPEWELFGRLHHRSGGKGYFGDTWLFNNADGGVQNAVLGLRYRF